MRAIYGWIKSNRCQPLAQQPAEVGCDVREILTLKSKLGTKMIARRWTGRVHAVQLDEYSALLRDGGPKRFATVPGSLGSHMAVRLLGDVAEFTVISYWEPEQAAAALREIAGEDITKVWNLDVDEKFLVDKPTVEHFHVLYSDHNGK